MKDYPYGSQMEKESKDIVIPVKVVDSRTGIVWWLSEYDPKSKVAFCYVTWFHEDEWGTVSLNELESLTSTFKTKRCLMICTLPRVTVDLEHIPTKFPELPFNKGYSH